MKFIKVDNSDLLFYNNDTDSFDCFFKYMKFCKLVDSIKHNKLDDLLEEDYLVKIYKTKNINNKLNLYKLFITRLDNELGNYLVQF